VPQSSSMHRESDEGGVALPSFSFFFPPVSLPPFLPAHSSTSVITEAQGQGRGAQCRCDGGDSLPKHQFA